MIALRNGFVDRRMVLDMVPLEDGNLFEMIGEHARRHQSRHAAADHDGPLPRLLMDFLLCPRDFHQGTETKTLDDLAFALNNLCENRILAIWTQPEAKC